jgi:phosphoribosylanthranilate isomerase
MRTRIKICGITRETDAQAAIAAGADAIGFVLWPASPRAITVDQAASIAQDVFVVARVGVFVDVPPATVASAVKAARLDAVQLHGDEHVEHYVHCGAPLIKAVTVTNDESIERALAIPSGVTLLVDAGDPTRRGGTGRVADWTLARRLAAERKIMLAGGLNSSNVARAIEEVQPWGVDVSSGVERAPGEKDAAAVAGFCQAVAAADRRSR